MIDVDALMRGLAEQRQVFHSEADFQHAFALEIMRADPLATVRLEYRPWETERLYLDVWARIDGTPFAAELKYLTRTLHADVNGELFSLANQAAQDVRRYDFWLDVARLERLTAHHPGLVAHAVCLTNDPGYWRPPRASSSIDAAFRLHEGRTATGRLSWAEMAGAGTTHGRAAPLSLSGNYVLRWADYAVVAGQQLRYLAVTIDARTHPSTMQPTQ